MPPSQIATGTTSYLLFDWRPGDLQTYATAQRKKADLQKQMSQKVFDVSMDAQEGALYSVLDEMSDQIVKEQLLAYFLLLKNRYPATEVRVQTPAAAAAAAAPRPGYMKHAPFADG